MVLQNPFSSLGPIGNFMYEGDTLGRKYYQGLANTKTYKDILGMADDAAFDKTLGKIKNPALNRLGYTARGLQSVGQSLLGFTPRVGSVNIGGGTIPGRIFYEKIMKNPFARALGYGTRVFTGMPGAPITGLYGISQAMRPGSGLSKFLKSGPTKYQKLQNELRLKQMKKQKDDLAERLAKLNVDKFKKMTNYVTGQQLHGGPSGKGPTTGGASKQKQRENRALGKKRGFNFGGR